MRSRCSCNRGETAAAARLVLVVAAAAAACQPAVCLPRATGVRKLQRCKRSLQLHQLLPHAHAGGEGLCRGVRSRARRGRLPPVQQRLGPLEQQGLRREALLGSLLVQASQALAQPRALGAAPALCPLQLLPQKGGVEVYHLCAPHRHQALLILCERSVQSLRAVPPRAQVPRRRRVAKVARHALVHRLLQRSAPRELQWLQQAQEARAEGQRVGHSSNRALVHDGSHRAVKHGAHRRCRDVAVARDRICEWA